MLKNFILLGFYIHLIYLFGCDSSKDNTLDWNLECVNINQLHELKIQHFYQKTGDSDYSVFHGTRGTKFKNAFKLRGGSNIIFDYQEGNRLDTETVFTGDGSDDDIRDGLDVYYYNTYSVIHSDYPYYLCGIKNISASQFLGLIGVTRNPRDPLWSFLFVNYIMSIYPVSYGDVCELTAAHELAHQIAVSDEGASCNGRYSKDTCVSKQGVDLGKQYNPFIAFCNYHGCQIWDASEFQDVAFQKQIKGNRLSSILSQQVIKSMDGVSIQLSLDKEIYLENESINLCINVLNNGSQDDSLLNLHTYGLAKYLLLKNDKNENYFYNSLIFNYLPLYTVIKAGGELNFNIELLSNYGSILQQSSDPAHKQYLPSEKYNIVLQMDDNYFGKTLASNSISFDIIQPTDNEQEALASLKAIFTIKDRIKRSLEYRNFIFSHINSNYMEQTFRDYLRLKIYDKKGEHTNMLLDDCKWFISVKPNSLYIKKVLSICCEIIEKNYSRNDVMNFLILIKAQNKTDKAAIEAEKLLLQYK